MKVLLAGGSGQVGTMLARYFHHNGHQVQVLSRDSQNRPWQTVLWDGATIGPWLADIDGCDVWINLAGRSVNCRYDWKNRRQILLSRLQSTAVLHEAIRRIEHPPAVWLNSSTATIYRHAFDRDMDEETGELGGHEPGISDTWRFSIEVAKAWEEAFFAAEIPGTRRVALRSAMIMSPDPGGVFDVFSKLVRHGLGGTNLPGTQFVSWIHEVDFIRAVEFLIGNSNLSGPVNLASPCPLPNEKFLRVLRQAWEVRVGVPTTRWMLEIGAFFLRTESELVLKSRRVVPGRLLQAGFMFRFPNWEQAAPDLVARLAQRHSDHADSL